MVLCYWWVYITLTITSKPEFDGLAGRYRHSGFFVLRTPLLPVASFGAWSDDGSKPPRLNHLRRSLISRFSEPHIADALRIASVGLADRLDRWTDVQPARRQERMDRTLVQYFARMCERCTPFGLFAGVSLGTIGTETRLRLVARSDYRRRSVLDFAQVAEFVSALLRQEEVRRAVRYHPNDTLADVAGEWQYVETSHHEGETSHHVASVEADATISAVLERSAEGATLTELRTAVAAVVPDVTEREIFEFIDDLIAAQVLLPELIPSVVGDDPLDELLERLDDLVALAGAKKTVILLRATLDHLDAQGVGAPREAYDAVNAVWTNELKQKSTDRLLQVDLFKPGDDLRIAHEVVDEVLRGADPLWRLADPKVDDMHELKRRFRERYDSREIPLAEAFDPERGIGVPGPDFEPRITQPPLLAGIALRTGQRGGGIHRPDEFSVLLARLMDSCGPVPQTLELDDELLDSLASPKGRVLPDALAIHFDLLASSEQAVRRGDYRIFFHGILGPSGARLLGRFCHLDPALREAVRGHLRDEEALEPDAIYAEIVHSPDGRVGNIVRRPNLRATELAYAGHRRRGATQRLTIDDLLLRLDGRRFHLRSRRDGRTVRPRLTAAHNFRASSGIYRFLCALQNDGIAQGITWSWRSLDELPFLPRVVRGRAIYAFARWRVTRDRPAYRAISAAKGRSAREGAAKHLVGELALPRWVRLADGDNRLLLDLENELCLTVLAEHAAKRPTIILEEVLGDDLDGCVEGPDGKYRNEIVFPLVRIADSKREADGLRRTSNETKNKPSPRLVQRAFAPGDEWLYFKIYCAQSTANHLLREVVAPLAAIHEQDEPMQPWFFIRYADPESHLRVRFRATPDTQRALQERATVMLRPLVESGTVHRVAIDTYVRETERYGGPLGIGLAENWFHADSVSILRIVEHLDADTDEALVWKATALGFDRLLADFALDFRERHRVVSKAREGFHREFDVGRTTRDQLARRFREARVDLEALVVGGVQGALVAAGQAFDDRSALTVDVVGALRKRAKGDELECSMDDLLLSLLHMHANRALTVSARVQEFVIHDFLSRTYRSLAARSQSASAVGRN